MDTRGSLNLPNCFLMLMVHDVLINLLVFGLEHLLEHGHLLGEGFKAGRHGGAE